MTTVIPILPPVPQRGQGRTDYIEVSDNWTRALPAFGEAVNAVGQEVTALAQQADQDADAAEDARFQAQQSADSAAASAASAAASPGTAATSTTSLSISTGSKTLNIQVGKTLSVGQFVVVAYTPTPGNYMLAQVRSYDSGTGVLQIDSTAFVGAGTYANWTVSLSAPMLSPNDDQVALGILAYLNF